MVTDYGEKDPRGSDEGASHACGSSDSCEGAATDVPASGTWSDGVRGSEEASDTSALASTAFGAGGADDERSTRGARAADESGYGEPLGYTRNKDS